ncbi:Sulfate transporter [Halotydeus destructor]|nr:Sulfate transporter [Halotydeus destructor]
MVKFLDNQDHGKPNFPSCPPTPENVRRDIVVNAESVHIEFEPEDKPELSHPANYETVKSVSSVLSAHTLDENGEVCQCPPDTKRDSVSWLDFEMKKTNHGRGHLTHKIGHSMHQNCERFSFKKMFLSAFPLFDRLQHYSLKEDLLADFIAGMTIAILHIPQGIAYSLLIGISPIYGLYTSFFPVFIYSFLGSAQHISIGTIAVLDIMLSEMVKKYSANYAAYESVASASGIVNVTTLASIMSSSSETITSTASSTLVSELSASGLNPHLPFTPIETLTSICILTGLLQLAFGFLQMGTISLILSDQLISGFSCGAAFHVIVSQLPPVFDLKGISEGNGPLQLIYQLMEVWQKLDSINYYTLVISSVVLVVVVVYKDIIEKKLQNKISFPIPIDLIIVVLGTVISTQFSFSEQLSVEVMGTLPVPTMPRLDYLHEILDDALILAVVSFAIALSLGKIYAKKHGYHVRANQEFVALGTANVVSSFFACFPATASLSRTSVMGKHAKSQMSSIFSCGVLLLVLLYLGPTLEQLPKCVVAVIIIVAQKSLIMQVKDCRRFWLISSYEGLTWLVTFASVILLGIDLGLIAGALFSVVSIIMRFYSPKLRRLGQLPYTDIYLDIHQHRAAKELSGLIILQFSSPLFFLNKELFQESVYKKAMGVGHSRDKKPATEHIIIDCSAMSFIDSAGVEALSEVSNELEKKGIDMALAACSPPVLSMLTRMNFFDKSPHTAIFPSVLEAAHAVQTDATPRVGRKMFQIVP